MKVPNQFRVRTGMLASNASAGNNGMFAIPHPNILGYTIYCMASDGLGWEHVSVSLRQKKAVKKKKHGVATMIVEQSVERCPTWQEMCFVKDQFWNKDEAVVQFHPPESEYVNNHKFCLHLWRPTTHKIILPDSFLVGTKSLNQ